MKKTIFAICMLGLIAVNSHAQSKVKCFDFGWKFTNQEITDGQSVSLDDSNWKSIDLPHDWDISHSPAANASTGKGGG